MALPIPRSMLMVVPLQRCCDTPREGYHNELWNDKVNIRFCHSVLKQKQIKMIYPRLLLAQRTVVANNTK